LGLWWFDGISDGEMDMKNVFQSPIWQGLSWGWYFNPEKKTGFGSKALGGAQCASINLAQD
jgi:hypothetical protein